MDISQPTPCSTCGSLIGGIPDPPPEISSVDSLQLELAMARGIISNAERCIIDLEEVKRRSLENHQSILRRLEEYQFFVFRQKSFVAPIRHFPSELLSEIFVTCVSDSPNSVSSSLWALERVCRRWRDIVLTTPCLWNRLPGIFATQSFLEAKPSQIQRHYTLSRGLPLSINVHINPSCIALTPLLNTVICHSDRISELKILCRWDALRLLSGMRSGLHNLQTLKLITTNRREDIDITVTMFSMAHRLRDVCFRSCNPLRGNQFTKLDVPWSQLKSVTISMLDLDHARMVLSQALHMEMCTFIQIAHVGNPHGIVRHVELKELSLKKGLNEKNSIFPATLSDILVLPNLISLVVELDQLTINSIFSLIRRSGCRLTKLVLNAPAIEGSLVTLLEEMASLVHLEVHTLLPADIEGLTVDRKNGKQPITPCLRVIHIKNSNGIAEPSSINSLIISRDDPGIPHLRPIQSMHVGPELPSYPTTVYGQLRGLPWMPSTEFEDDQIFEWAKSLRELIARLPPKYEDISLLHSILDGMGGYKTNKQPYLATSEMYESLVYISSFGWNHLRLPKGWSQLQKRARLLLNSWTVLKEEYGKFPQRNWKRQSQYSMSYFAPK